MAEDEPFIFEKLNLNKSSQNEAFISDIPIPDADDSDIFDPFCDPANPVCISFKEVSTASYKIRDGIIRTPCKKSLLSKENSMNLFLKLDFLQVTGSFKERGARYTLLRLKPEQRQLGVIASSAGNHAQALAYHGQQLHIPVTVVMPTIAPLMKIESCINYGARVIVKGVDLGEAKRYALKLAKLNNLTFINGYDHPQILAGQGTVALEVLEQVDEVDAVIVPVGGGGLIAGVAVAIKGIDPRVEVIGVESNQCAAFAASLAAGKPVLTNCLSTIADGLAVPLVGINSLESSKGVVDRMIAVDESYITRAILRLLEVEKCVVEGAGATSLAAIMSGQLSDLQGKTVVALLTGGNIDTTVLGRVIERGLVLEGRMCRFLVVVSDRPGGIAELCNLLKSLQVSIKDIFHERAWLTSSVFSVQVKCVCETRDLSHAAQLEKLLRERYTHVQWGKMPA